MTAVLVTADNFARAESDLYFSKIVGDGGFGRFTHNRELTPLDKQLVVRSNRDTLYSAGIFDLDAGTVTITMPDPGGRFMSMQVITEDHYVPAVFYGQGEHVLTRDDAGTRYVMRFAPLSIRTSRPISTRSTRCKTPSRCSRMPPAPSRYPTGTR